MSNSVDKRAQASPEVRGAKGLNEGTRGQSLVETALILPIVMLLLMGIIDFGFVLYAHVQVAAAAGEGARAGSLVLINPDANNPGLTDNDSYRRAQVKAAVTRAMGRLNAAAPNFRPNGLDGQDGTAAQRADDDVTITYIPSTPTPSDNVTRTRNEMVVEVRYRQRLFFNLLPGMVGDFFQVGSQARIRIQ